MTYQTLLSTLDGPRATITLNRPDVRNAFNEVLIAELKAVFTELGANPAVRVIILAANGPTFCAGADLNWMQKMAGYSHAENLADARQLADMLHVLYTCPKPIIAQVQGDAYAGGMGLVAVCDVVVASQTAHFCLSEAKLGLLPATISPYVIQAMGAQAARRYFLTAEVFDALQARQIGFAHEVVPADQLRDTVDNIATALSKNSPAAVVACKRLVQDMAHRPIDAALREDTALRIADIRASEEGKEGVRSFLEKRKPSWLS